jgi:hypothetical protein
LASNLDSNLREYHQDILVDDQRAFRRDRIWNILSIFVLLMILGVIVATYMIFSNPQASINPFPPATMPAMIVLPSPTATLRMLPPTWTATVPPVTPTETPIISVGSSGLPEGTIQPSPTRDLSASAPFILQGDPVAVASSMFHADTTCDWLGVGGNVYDMQGRPVFGLMVKVGGTLGGKTVKEMTTLTGLARAYGESGYEFKLGAKPVASNDSLWIQLFDQAQIPISEKIYFDTYAECNMNLVLINFKQVR